VVPKKVIGSGDTTWCAAESSEIADKKRQYLLRSSYPRCVYCWLRLPLYASRRVQIRRGSKARTMTRLHHRFHERGALPLSMLRRFGRHHIAHIKRIEHRQRSKLMHALPFTYLPADAAIPYGGRQPSITLPPWHRMPIGPARLVKHVRWRHVAKRRITVQLPKHFNSNTHWVDVKVNTDPTHQYTTYRFILRPRPSDATKVSSVSTERR
jgi:hypothetical protein